MRSSSRGNPWRRFPAKPPVSSFTRPIQRRHLDNGDRSTRMIKTHGLSRIALSVADLDRSVAFYVAVFGVRKYIRNESTVQVLGPGAYDVIAFEKRPEGAGVQGGIIHFGFRLTPPEDIEAAVAAMKRAGGTINSRGEFAPGLPFAFVRDPDGYEIEIWFE
jgi:catechol 2,3-dioxygenase-like lactoylglutathione lyase family enzyme